MVVVSCVLLFDLFFNASHIGLLDLREDKHYLADHPGLVPVTTAQV